MINSWWRLPDRPLRSSVQHALVASALVTVALILAVRSAVDAGPAYPRICLGLLTVAGLLVTGRIGAHHPFDRVGPANLVTLFRVTLVAAVTGLVAEAPSETAAWLVVGAATLVALLDGVDGWLARRSRMSSAFGARFDMETDAVTILVLSVLVWRYDKAGLWVIACGLMRYAFIAAGWMLPWMGAPLRSTRRGKTVAIAQLAGLALALCPFVHRPGSAVVAAVTLAALAWSFALDVLWLWGGRLTASR